MRFSVRVSCGLIVGLAFVLSGCGKNDTAPADKKDAKQQAGGTGGSTGGSTGATTGESSSGGSTGGSTTASSDQAVEFAAGDIRGYLPSDAQFGLLFQPQKVWKSKFVTTLAPEEGRKQFLTQTKRELPVDPETIEKILVCFSTPPAGFPAKKLGGDDPTAYFYGVIQFNDSQKMSDRLKKFVDESPLNKMSGVPGEGWWGSRKDMDPSEDEAPRKMRFPMMSKKADGKTSYQMFDESGKMKEITEDEYKKIEEEDKKVMEKRKERSKLMKTPNRRVSETPDQFDIVFYAPTNQTLIVGLKSRVDEVIKGGGPSALKAQFKNADMAHDLIIAGTKLDEFKPPEKILKEIGRDPMMGMMIGSALMQLAQFKDVLLQIGASPGANLVDVRVTAKEEATAAELEKALVQARDQGKQAAGSKLGPAGENAAAKQALEELDKNWKVSRNGAELHLSIAHTEKFNQLVIDAALPMVKAASAAASRTQDRNNFKMIGLSLYNFESSYRKFPPGGGKGDLRESLPTEKQVGWMYDILPFMEQSNVHNKVKKDKAWDDPANKEAGATVIPNYVNSETPVEMVNGYAPTHIVGIGGLGETGPNEPLDSKKAGFFGFKRDMKLSSVADGTSNTIMAAQAYKSFGPWIANTNATIRPFTKQPYLHGPDGIGGPGKSGTAVLMADGSVRTLSDATDPSVIEALTTINGGETNTNPDGPKGAVGEKKGPPEK